MSYTVEEKEEALEEQNKIINALSLSVIDIEKEQCDTIFLFVLLIAIGLCCLGFCLVVYGI